MAMSQEEYENQPKEQEAITRDDVGSLEDVIGTDFFERIEFRPSIVMTLNCR